MDKKKLYLFGRSSIKYYLITQYGLVDRLDYEQPIKINTTSLHIQVISFRIRIHMKNLIQNLFLYLS